MLAPIEIWVTSLILRNDDEKGLTQTINSTSIQTILMFGIAMNLLRRCLHNISNSSTNN